jgi:hypothetical protein
MEYQRIDLIGVREGLWREESFFAGLAGFSLRYTNNDHKIRFISAGGTNANRAMRRHDYTLGLYDQSEILDSEDIFRAWSKYLDLGPIQEEFVMGTFERRGTVTLSIPPIGEEDSFVLRGFSITKTGSHDHNIRKIGVRLNSARNGIVVTFQDNSPDDDGFEVKVVYGRVVSARASYNMATQFIGPYTSEQTFTVSTSIPKENEGLTLLTGLYFEFLDTDHFIREIKIDPQNDEKFDVTFTDNEEDNPVKVILDYIKVNVIR